MSDYRNEVGSIIQEDIRLDGEACFAFNLGALTCLLANTNTRDLIGTHHKWIEV